MAEHVAFVSLSRPPPTGAPPHLMPHEHWKTSSELPHRAQGHLNGDELSNGANNARRLLFSILQHDKFDTLFPCIKSCLQLSDEAWSRLSKLRTDPQAKLVLESSHPSIYHIPPQDVWSLIVQLRQCLTFYSQQLSIVAEVEHAHCRTHSSTSTQCSYQPSSDDTSWGQSDTTAAKRVPSYNQNVFTSFTDAERNPSTVPSNSDQRTVTSLSPPIKSSVAGNNGVQKRHSKQAPEGMLFFCPSRGCVKTFKREAHYTKHLNRHHPDFGPRHPNHFPQMALRSRTASNTSNERPKAIVRFKDETLSVNEDRLSGGRDFATSRRGSHLSLSSLNSLGVSSQAIDDTSDDALNRDGDFPVFQPMMSDENSMWYMGGGAQIDSMNMGSGNIYFGGVRNN